MLGELFSGLNCGPPALNLGVLMPMLCTLYSTKQIKVQRHDFIGVGFCEKGF